MLSTRTLKVTKLVKPTARYVATTTDAQNINIFKDCSMVSLIKKAVVYKASQNDFVLKHGDSLTHKSYKIFGKTITNSVIENTGGQIFTSGPTIKTLTADAERLYTDHGIWSAGNYVLEGIEEDKVDIFDAAKDYLVDSLEQFAKGRPHCHLAIKLTGLGHMHMFKNYNDAQHMLLKGMFDRYSSQSEHDEWNVITRIGVEQFLKDNQFEYTSEDVDEFFKVAKFSDSDYPSDQIGEIEFYENVHAHYVYSDNHNSAIISKVCEKNGLDQATRE